MWLAPLHTPYANTEADAALAVAVFETAKSFWGQIRNSNCFTSHETPG